MFVTPDGIASGARELVSHLPELRDAVLAQQQEITTRWLERRGSRLMQSVRRLAHREEAAC